MPQRRTEPISRIYRLSASSAASDKKSPRLDEGGRPAYPNKRIQRGAAVEIGRDVIDRSAARASHVGHSIENGRVVFAHVCMCACGGSRYTSPPSIKIRAAFRGKSKRRNLEYDVVCFAAD